MRLPLWTSRSNEQNSGGSALLWRLWSDLIKYLHTFAYIKTRRQVSINPNRNQRVTGWRWRKRSVSQMTLAWKCQSNERSCRSTQILCPQLFLGFGLITHFALPSTCWSTFFVWRDTSLKSIPWNSSRRDLKNAGSGLKWKVQEKKL